MVYLTLVSDDGETVTYDYMPEREDAPKGTVTVSRSSGTCGIPKRAPDDDFRWYAGHAWQRIKAMLASGDLRERTCAAWY
ncbi:hypothetical protein I3I95_10550 [bacterium]|nr:hypothetical protein [bacterium]